ncbi:hypothetical protein [Bradyrhizobium lupini]
MRKLFLPGRSGICEEGHIVPWAWAWRSGRFQPSALITPEALEAFFGTKIAAAHGGKRNISA